MGIEMGHHDFNFSLIPKSALERVKITLGEYAQILSEDLSPEEPLRVRRLEVVISEGKDVLLESLFKRILPIHTLTLHWGTPDMKMLGTVLRSNKLYLQKVHITAINVDKEEYKRLKELKESRLVTLSMEGKPVFNNIFKIDTLFKEQAPLDYLLDCDNPPKEFPDLFAAMQAFVMNECTHK